MNIISNFLFSGAIVSTVNSYISAVLQELFPNHIMMTGRAPETGSASGSGTGSGSATGSGNNTATGSGNNTATGSGNNTASNDNKATASGSTVPESTDNNKSDSESESYYDYSPSAQTTDSEDLDTIKDPNTEIDRLIEERKDLKRYAIEKKEYLLNGGRLPQGKTFPEALASVNSQIQGVQDDIDMLNNNRPDS